MGKTSSATSNAALQLHCATPKRVNEDSRGRADVRASRYRLLDEREQAREAQEIERLQRALQQQRRPRPKASSRASSPKRSGGGHRHLSDESPPPYDSVSRSRSTKESRQHEPPSPRWSEGDGDEGVLSSDNDVRVAPVAASDFQAQVLRELQKLKQAQQKDLEAIQTLQREKAEAERKARAFEMTLRERSQRRPPALAFGDLDGGDESAPPTLLSSALSDDEHTADFTEEEFDHTDTEISPRPSQRSQQEASVPSPQPIDSPVFVKRRPQQRRPTSASSRSDRRPQSARSRTRDASDDDEHEARASRGRSLSSSTRSHSRSASRARSASREDLRRSCAFFEEKQKTEEEEQARQQDTQRRLERAARATPPANLLKRQDEAQRKKREQLHKLEKERDAELSPTKRVRARDVPPTTYAPPVPTEEREDARKARVLQRSQELLAQAELPSRMQLAKEQELANAKAMEAAAAAARSTRMAASLAMSMAVSVKARRKLQEQLDAEEKRRQLMRPTPVPNFTLLQSQWDKALSVKKSKHKPTEPQRFFASREQQLDDLRARKEARKRKMAEHEAQLRQQELEKQRAVLERAKKTPGTRVDGPRLTKADELRMKKVQEALHQQRRQEEKEKCEQERRNLRLKEASRRVTAQVRQHGGDVRSPGDVENLAKEKAKKERAAFREAVQRNKERLVAAVATKPSLMERFAIDLKRVEHKKNALEAVVKQVFQKNFKDMKGILTEEEEELARDLVAADEAEEKHDEEAAEGSTTQSHEKEDEENDDHQDAD